MTTASLPPSVSGNASSSPAPGGATEWYVAGEGAPLLLVAPASTRLPRPPRCARCTSTAAPRDVSSRWSCRATASRARRPAYTPRLMTDAIHAMTAEIRRRCGDGPIDALALSLSSEFLARAAMESPAAYRSLALVSRPA